MNGSITVNTDTISDIRNYSNNILDNDIKFTSIIILTYNNLEYTKLCIESIRTFTPKDCYEIIIVDNNSTDDTRSWLKEQVDLRIILNDFNLGFPVGCNVGIDIASGENILLLNNDTIVTPDWLSHLNTALYSAKEIGAVGAITNSCSNGQQVGVSYINIEQMVNLSREIYMLNKNGWEYKTKLVGFCYMIKKSVLDEIGLLDPIFTPGNYEDDDISLRILKAGYNLLLCKDTFIHHFGSASFNENKVGYHNYLEINRYKLNDKWKFDVNSKMYANFELLEIMNNEIKKNMKVLQVNCGIGADLLQIKNKFKNVKLYGLESNEEMAKIANGICNVTVGKITDIGKNYEKDFFDYIILGDVLEHIEDPWGLLRNISKYLKPNGMIITIIPNINYVAVIKELIEGQFGYVPWGVLNKDHLRFFTLNEVNKLFNNAGYNVKYLIKDKGNISEKEKNLINNICNLYGDKIKEEYMCYQYRIAANKIIDIERYNNLNMIKLKYMIMRIDNDFYTKETFDNIFELCEENCFGSDVKYLIDNNVINKKLVLSRILDEAIDRELNHLVDDLGGLYYEQ